MSRIQSLTKLIWTKANKQVRIAKRISSHEILLHFIYCCLADKDLAWFTAGTAAGESDSHTLYYLKLFSTGYIRHYQRETALHYLQTPVLFVFLSDMASQHRHKYPDKLSLYEDPYRVGVGHLGFIHKLPWGETQQQPRSSLASCHIWVASHIRTTWTRRMLLRTFHQPSGTSWASWVG